MSRDNTGPALQLTRSPGRFLRWQITVLVSAPVLGNSLIPFPSYGPANIEARCVMLKEL